MPFEHDKRSAGKVPLQLDSADASKRAGLEGSLRAMNYDEAAASLSPVHAKAEEGMKGNGGKLPHYEAVQRAFGAHDVSGVKAHVGGAARESAQDLGAKAYARGSEVAFAQSPDLHTAAHEAAHVVQQRGGVQLKGNVGQSGDKYEAHADAVADRVVQGKSAEDLLAPYAGGTQAGEAVQMKSLKTHGGTFTTQQYEALTGAAKDGNQLVGTVMDMKFAPGQSVRADKFGFVQTVKAMRNDKADYSEGRVDQHERMQKEGEDPDPGRLIDQGKNRENPLFSLKNQSSPLGSLGTGIDEQALETEKNLVRGLETNVHVERGDAPSKDGGKKPKARKKHRRTPTTSKDQEGKKGELGGKKVGGGKSSSSQKGTRKKKRPSKGGEAPKTSDFFGAQGKKVGNAVTPAFLRDEPARTRAYDPETNTGDAVEMSFETNVLTTEGPTAGTYLGSVQWGFKADSNSPTAKPMPFEVVSMGTPSREFMASAQLWNENAKTHNTESKNPSLPLHYTSHRPDLGLEAQLRDPKVSVENKKEAIKQRIEHVVSKLDPEADKDIQQLALKMKSTEHIPVEVSQTLDRLANEFMVLRLSLEQSRTDRRDLRSELQKAEDALAQAKKVAKKPQHKVFRFTKGSKDSRSDYKDKKSERNRVSNDLESKKSLVDKLETDVNDKRLEQNDPQYEQLLLQHRENVEKYQNKLADYQNMKFEIDSLRKMLKQLGD
jgi:hypothetical protein